MNNFYVKNSAYYDIYMGVGRRGGISTGYCDMFTCILQKFLACSVLTGGIETSIGVSIIIYIRKDSVGVG